MTRQDSSPPGAESPQRERHNLFEDVQAILTGTLMIAFGLNLYAHGQFLTGGVAGLALLGHYLTGLSVGTCLFVINLPFYYLGYRRMGPAFIVRTFAAVTALALFSDLIPQVIRFQDISPLFATIFGGCLVGVGFILIFRHGTSLGGVSILALYCQDRYGVSAGKVQMGIDSVILLLAFLTISWESALYSVIGTVLINGIMIINFKRARYNGFS